VAQRKQRLHFRLSGSGIVPIEICRKDKCLPGNMWMLRRTPEAALPRAKVVLPSCEVSFPGAGPSNGLRQEIIVLPQIQLDATVAMQYI